VASKVVRLHVPSWRRASRQALQILHVAPRLLPRLLGEASTPPTDFICVYRARNVKVVLRMLGDLPPDCRVALWALDDQVPVLARHTIGAGPGLRIVLLNRLAASLAAEDRWLIVGDDDVRMPRGQLNLWLRTAMYAQLDLSQPTHLARSNASWQVNRQRLVDYVRIGRWVEAGPLLAFSPIAREIFLPMPEELGMGWGVEAIWASGVDRGMRFGIVDAVGMRHLGQVASQYARSEQEAMSLRVLGQLGYASFSELHDERGRWWLWQRTPPWRDGVVS